MSVSLGLVLLLVLVAFVLGLLTTPLLVYMRLVKPSKMHQAGDLKRP